MIDFKPLISQICAKQVLDAALLEAFCWTESNMDPFAVRYESNWKYLFQVDENARELKISQDTEKHLQMFSYGLGQVMGSVARELGFKGSLLKMADPVIGLEFSAKKLKSLTKKYTKMNDVIASYNAGSTRFNVEGAYINQDYVNKVLSKYMELDGKR